MQQSWCIIGRAGASPLSLTTGTNFASSVRVSPDTVSLLNVSTRFYLGAQAVRNIARTEYIWISGYGHGSRRKQHLALA